MGLQFSLHTIKKILFQTHLLTCKCHPVRFSVITITGSCTSTPTPKINFTRGHASWEKGKTLLAQKEIDWVCICSWGFFLFFQFSLRTINKILFQTHLLTCKCHPVRFSVINNPSLVELTWAVWRNIAKLIRGGPLSFSSIQTKLFWVPLT